MRLSITTLFLVGCLPSSQFGYNRVYCQTSASGSRSWTELDASVTVCVTKLIGPTTYLLFVLVVLFIFVYFLTKHLVNEVDHLSCSLANFLIVSYHVISCRLVQSDSDRPTARRCSSREVDIRRDRVTRGGVREVRFHTNPREVWGGAIYVSPLMGLLKLDKLQQQSMYSSAQLPPMSARQLAAKVERINDTENP